MASELKIESAVRISNLTIRKAGMSFKVSVPPFWVTNEGMREGDSLEAFIDVNGALILCPVKTEGRP